MSQPEQKKADKKLSLLIRARDPMCSRCRAKPSTDASHYWGRNHSATRYDPRNVDGLCRACHGIWEGRRNGYEEFKRKQLGPRAYLALERVHNTIVSREEAANRFLITQII